MPRSQLVNYAEALEQFANKLEKKRSIKVGSFEEFTRNVWSKGYEHPEYFESWHVSLICNDVEKALQDGYNYVCVMPRLHLKSTVLGHSFSVWNFLRSTSGFDSDILYLSYSDGLAQEHIQNINRYVRRNEQLMEWMEDRSPDADYAFNYHISECNARILHGGIFSFKRGLHVNKAMIVDDILRDPENPLNMTQMAKIENFFYDESMFIPNKEAIIVVIGTPMLPGDLLTKLKSDERFQYRFLPALDPMPGKRVLFSMLFNEDWLLRQQSSRPNSFAKEFLLAP